MEGLSQPVVYSANAPESPTRTDAVATRRDAMKGDDARVAASASSTEFQTPVARAPTRREEDASSTPVPRLDDASDEISTPSGAAVKELIAPQLHARCAEVLAACTAIPKTGGLNEIRVLDLADESRRKREFERRPRTVAEALAMARELDQLATNPVPPSSQETKSILAVSRFESKSVSYKK